MQKIRNWKRLQSLGKVPRFITLCVGGITVFKQSAQISKGQMLLNNTFLLHKYHVTSFQEKALHPFTSQAHFTRTSLTPYPHG